MGLVEGQCPRLSKASFIAIGRSATARTGPDHWSSFGAPVCLDPATELTRCDKTHRPKSTGGCHASQGAIAEGYIPSNSTGPAPEMTSPETLCLLNAGTRGTLVQIPEHRF